MFAMNALVVTVRDLRYWTRFLCILVASLHLVHLLPLIHFLFSSAQHS